MKFKSIEEVINLGTQQSESLTTVVNSWIQHLCFFNDVGFIFRQNVFISIFSSNNFLSSDLYLDCKLNIANKIDFLVQYRTESVHTRRPNLFEGIKKNA